MCIAAPAKIVEIDTESNICAADFGGVRQKNWIFFQMWKLVIMY